MNYINKKILINHQNKMHKTKSLLYSHKKQHSSSPDTKRSNIVKPTNSPIQQIQKFLAINHHQAKLKSQTTHTHTHASNSKVIPSNQKSQGVGVGIGKEEEYRKRIKELEDEVGKYKGYMGEYQELAIRNKRLEEQMTFILEELQARCINDTQSNAGQATEPSPKNRRQKTLSSTNQYSPQIQIQQASPSSYHLQSGSPNRSPSSQQLDYLYQYIQNLQQTIKQILSQTQQFQSDLKKGFKKDLTQMEQRLMNYIFGLEERVSQSTFRNYDLLKKIQSARKDEDGDCSNYFQLSMTEGKSVKKDSMVSMINIEVSNQSDNPMGADKSMKSQHSLVQTPKISSKICEKCCQYTKIIEQLTQKNKKLEQEVQKFHSLLKQTKKQLITIQNQKYPQPHHSELKSAQTPTKTPPIHKQSHQNSLQQIRQQQSSRQQQPQHTPTLNPNPNPNLKSPKPTLLQSNINVLIDSSNESSFTQQKPHPSPNSQQQYIPKSQAASMENYLKLEKVKDQIINVMQELQDIVHTCDCEEGGGGGGGLVGQVNRKVKEQVEYICQLEEEVSRLRMEVEEGKRSREKLEKFMKLQVREQQQAQSPYFRTLSQPLSCIDHKATKGKINHILSQIKKFQIELDEPGQKPQKNKASLR